MLTRRVGRLGILELPTSLPQCIDELPASAGQLSSRPVGRPGIVANPQVNRRATSIRSSYDYLAFL